MVNLSSDVEKVYWIRTRKLHQAMLEMAEREVEKLKHWIELDTQEINKLTAATDSQEGE